MIAIGIYIAAVLLANLTATLFLPVPLYPGAEVLVSVGTLVFGITFTQRDRIHHFGRRTVYAVILSAAVLNLCMLASVRYLWGAAAQAAFEARNWEALAQAMGMLRESGLRVFVASFVATVLAEAADTEVYHRLLERRWWARVTRSNAVSIPIDSLLFNLIAFAGSAYFPALVLVKVILGEIIAKFAVGLLWAVSLPKRLRGGVQ